MRPSYRFLAIGSALIVIAVLLAGRVARPFDTNGAAAGEPPLQGITATIALNEAVCITAPTTLLGVDAAKAALGCQNIDQQDNLSNFYACIAIMYDYDYYCRTVPYHGLNLNPEPTEFTSIDLDDDIVQQGQVLAILAFTDTAGPVTFDTSIGTILSPADQPLGASATCNTEDSDGSVLGDPDCDAMLGGFYTDGVVAARILMRPSDSLGSGLVTVTQGGVSKEHHFQVTGGAKTLTFEPLDAQISLEGAGLSPCPPVFTDPVSGSVTPFMARFLVRALDDQGTPVVGALIDWSEVFGQVSSPNGGAASFGSPTWIFGSRGPGAVLTVCGGGQPGILTVEGRFNLILNSTADSEYANGITFPVTSINCIDSGASWQHNADGEIPRLWNDATNPDGDFIIDDCDDDMDGDGMGNEEEAGLGMDPANWDQDGDLIADVAEIRCQYHRFFNYSDLLGSDFDNDRLPDHCEADFGSDPFIPDTDGDGLLDGVEVRYWLSDPTKVNTDGDDCSDGREVATVNGDRTVNVADFGLLASKFGPVPVNGRPYDLNGDGVINMADLGFAASKKGACISTP